MELDRKESRPHQHRNQSTTATTTATELRSPELRRGESSDDADCGWELRRERCAAQKGRARQRASHCRQYTRLLRRSAADAFCCCSCCGGECACDERGSRSIPRTQRVIITRSNTSVKNMLPALPFAGLGLHLRRRFRDFRALFYRALLNTTQLVLLFSLLHIQNILVSESQSARSDSTSTEYSICAVLVQ